MDAAWTEGSKSRCAISVEVLISFSRWAMLCEVEIGVSYFTASSFIADRCNGNYPDMF
jgi:hypothetical protein